MRLLKLLLLFLICLPVYAATTAPQIDTIRIDNRTGLLLKFVASWGTQNNPYTVSTTLDTITAPQAGSQVLIIHDGAATTDTIQVSFSQLTPSGGATIAKFTTMLVKAGETFSMDFKAAVIKRLIVKGSGTIKCRFKIIN